MQLQAHLAVVGEFPGELHAAGKLSLIVDAAAQVVGDVALVVGGGEGGAGGEAVGQRPADGAFGVEAAEIAARDIQIAIQLVGRLVTEILDQAPGGVASEERALRTAQDFDPLRIKQRSGQCPRGGNVGVIGIYGDRRLLVVAEVVLGHATQVVDGDR